MYTNILYFNSGDPIPSVEYTNDEKETWRKVYSTLRPLHATGACVQYLNAIDELETCGLYSADDIPQMNDVSEYLNGEWDLRKGTTIMNLHVLPAT